MKATTTQLYSLFQKSSGVTTDSRNCPANSLFFALKGEAFNGNQYALSALEKGCIAAIVDEAAYATNPRIYLVDDVLNTLQELAHLHRITLKTPIIQITGTNGKTTTKELLAAVLTTTFTVHYTVGNLNNHIGVPLTLLQLTPRHEVAVIETGANHPGEIATLTKIVAPDFGLITNVGKAHLEGFGSFEGVINTKCELYDYIRKANGTLFVCNENPYLMPRSEGIKRICYGENPDLFVSGKLLPSTPCMTFILTHDHTSVEIKTQLVGNYNLSNALAAAAIGLSLGVPLLSVKKALSNYTPQNKRSQLTITPHNRLIVDAYNANPTSMAAAITNMAAMEVTDKMLILGDMRELGIESKKEHQQVVDQIAQLGFKRVILVGKEFGNTVHTFKHFGTIEATKEHLKQNPIKGQFILLKGSRGMKMEEILELL